MIKTVLLCFLPLVLVQTSCASKSDASTLSNFQRNMFASIKILFLERLLLAGSGHWLLVILVGEMPEQVADL